MIIKQIYIEECGTCPYFNDYSCNLMDEANHLDYYSVYSDCPLKKHDYIVKLKEEK